MVDSTTVLWGQTLAYTFYVLAIMAVMGWFALRVTQEGPNPAVKPALLLRVRRRSSSSWASRCTSSPTTPFRGSRWTCTGPTSRPTRCSTSGWPAHRFQLPAETLQVACNDKVLFNVTSRDLTYGFGLFRHDHSMLFQMQVVPGHVNDILWQFDKPGVYTIRSTEYSGPTGVDMIVKDAVVVSCDQS